MHQPPQEMLTAIVSFNLILRVASCFLTLIVPVWQPRKPRSLEMKRLGLTPKPVGGQAEDLVSVARGRVWGWGGRHLSSSASWYNNYTSCKHCSESFLGTDSFNPHKVPLLTGENTVTGCCALQHEESGSAACLRSHSYMHQSRIWTQGGWMCSIASVQNSWKIDKPSPWEKSVLLWFCTTGVLVLQVRECISSHLCTTELLSEIIMSLWTIMIFKFVL